MFASYWCPIGLKREPGVNPGLSPQLYAH